MDNLFKLVLEMVFFFSIMKYEIGFLVLSLLIDYKLCLTIPPDTCVQIIGRRSLVVGVLGL